MNGIMSNAVTYLSNYGLEMIPSIRGLSLFDVVNPEQTDSGLAIDDANGSFRMLDVINKTTLDASVCKLLTGDLVLELLYV